MIRTFCDWWENVHIDIKTDNKKIPINIVDYIWINNTINNLSNENEPTVDEIFEWIKSDQIDAIRR